MLRECVQNEVSLMVFMMGITEGSGEIPFHQTFVCGRCGKYGRYRVFMTYMVLSLFFIPVFKWNRRYFAEATCCHSIYELKTETGKRIFCGEQLAISDEDFIGEAYGQGYGWGGTVRRCAYCGYETSEDFQYCPKCGREFV